VRLPLRPVGEAGDTARHVLLTPDVDAMLDGQMHFGDFPQVEAERLIATFCANWFITVSRKKTAKRPDIEQLQEFDEVWALCPRKPPPGWRILGRFYAKNVFIGTRAWDKHVLWGRYAAAAQEVIDDWTDLFGEQPAHTGVALDDYLGKAYYDVDQ
jgi:hypothetical protein